MGAWKSKSDAKSAISEVSMSRTDDTFAEVSQSCDDVTTVAEDWSCNSGRSFPIGNEQRGENATSTQSPEKKS